MLLKKNNLFFLTLSLLMAGGVVLSNFLVQFPFKHYGLEDMLTYGAFSYPIAFLINDLTNRIFGKNFAKKVVYIGFFTGIFVSFLFTFNNVNFIAIRIVFGSGIAFLVAQLLDVKIFDIFRYRTWFLPPLISSFFSSIVDTFIFFFIAFYATGLNWLYLGFGDLCVKIFVAVIMLIPFRTLIYFTKRLVIEEENLI